MAKNGHKWLDSSESVRCQKRYTKNFVVQLTFFFFFFFGSTLGYNEFIKQLEVEREREKMLRKLMIERETQGWWEVPVGSWGAWLAGATYNKETNHKKSRTRIFVKIMEMRLRASSYSIFTQNIGQGFKNFFAANTSGNESTNSSLDYDHGTKYF